MDKQPLINMVNRLTRLRLALEEQVEKDKQKRDLLGHTILAKQRPSIQEKIKNLGYKIKSTELEIQRLHISIFELGNIIDETIPTENQKQILAAFKSIKKDD